MPLATSGEPSHLPSWDAELAEGGGFEPTMSFPIPVFKTGRRNRLTCWNAENSRHVVAPWSHVSACLRLSAWNHIDQGQLESAHLHSGREAGEPAARRMPLLS